MTAAQAQPPTLQPLLRSALAILKAAQENHYEITRTKLVKLLYFADLEAVENGGTPISGATWRWDNYGPYDHAVRRAEESAITMDVVYREELHFPDYVTHRLTLIEDIADPLPDESMEIVRSVVKTLGGHSAGVLKELSYTTPPMVEATAAGDRMVLLDLGQARRSKQAKALLDRHRRIRRSMPARFDDPGVGDELLEEMSGGLADLRGRVNAEELGDQ
jgi:uncharacterized phage-associated protein